MIAVGRFLASSLVLICILAGCGGGDEVKSFRLVARTPMADTVNDQDVVVSGTFSSKPERLSAQTGFSLTDSLGREVKATVTVDGNQARLRPVDPLPAGRYFATFASDVADDAGRVIGEPARWAFDVAQYLVITIDVEALPARQSSDHVDRLIYGDFGSRGRAGIFEMMDIADKHKVRLTFFLDVLEDVLYPGQIESVARLIISRGHDLQLHFHPTIMPDKFFAELGFERKDTNKFSETEAEALFGKTIRITENWGVPKFLAFRAGSYRYDQAFVRVAPEYGIRYSYNYNIRGPSQFQYGLTNSPAFRWENDVLEVPVSFVRESRMPEVRFDDATYLPPNDIPRSYRLISTFEKQWDSPNVLVMMLHSWSFLDLVIDSVSGNEYFEYKSSAKVKMFEKFLDSLPAHVRVVTASELDKLVADGKMAISRRMSTAEVFE